METGIAQGGPRDRVRLSASASWDGRVEQVGAVSERAFAEGGSTSRRYYPGRYKWCGHPYNTWVWVPDPPRSR